MSSTTTASARSMYFTPEADLSAPSSPARRNWNRAGNGVGLVIAARRPCRVSRCHRATALPAPSPSALTWVVRATRMPGSNSFSTRFAARRRSWGTVAPREGGGVDLSADAIASADPAAGGPNKRCCRAYQCNRSRRRGPCRVGTAVPILSAFNPPVDAYGNARENRHGGCVVRLGPRDPVPGGGDPLGGGSAAGHRDFPDGTARVPAAAQVGARLPGHLGLLRRPGRAGRRIPLPGPDHRPLRHCGHRQHRRRGAGDPLGRPGRAVLDVDDRAGGDGNQIL